VTIFDSIKLKRNLGGQAVFITGVALGILIGAPLGFLLSSLLETGRTELE